jgi:pectinesterase
MNQTTLIKRQMHFLLSLLAYLLISATSAFATQTDLYVAADGSAKYKSVQEAVMAVPAGSPDNPVIIHIKPGVYKELIYIQHEKRFFHLVGEDAEKTVLTYDLNANLIGKDNKHLMCDSFKPRPDHQGLMGLV